VYLLASRSSVKSRRYLRECRVTARQRQVQNFSFGFRDIYTLSTALGWAKCCYKTRILLGPTAFMIPVPQPPQRRKCLIPALLVPCRVWKTGGFSDHAHTPAQPSNCTQNSRSVNLRLLTTHVQSALTLELQSISVAERQLCILVSFISIYGSLF